MLYLSKTKTLNLFLERSKKAPHTDIWQSVKY